VSDLNNPELYINRELSWLKFNTRVLQEAHNKNWKLLDQLKYLAIYGTNLDEFYMIRVAGLKELFKAGVNATSADNLTPLEQLLSIREEIHNEQSIVEKEFKRIFKELEPEGIYIKNVEDLNDTQKEKVEEYFYANLFPVIIPIAVDATHPFPHLNNLSFGMVVKTKEDGLSKHKYSLIRIPRILPRFIEIEHGLFIPIESIVKNYVSALFPNNTLISSMAYRVTRNADLAIEEEEADDLMEVMEQGLRLRQKGDVVRLEIENTKDDDLIKFLTKHIDIYRSDIYRYSIPMNLGTLWQIVGHKDFAHLTEPSSKPVQLPDLDVNKNMFDVIDQKDISLYHPYESFDPVVKFIQQASKDPDVVAIKMTLYRVGKNSPIVKALIDASNDGKQVTAMVELKARFDEENNLHWAKALESAGAHVVYGIKGLKVHAKIALVIKSVNGKLKNYVHLSTGNYNPTTARIYTDISLFTCKESIGKDATLFFHHLTGSSSQNLKLNSLCASPTQTKPTLLALIAKEADMGKDGRIILKSNALVDNDIIKALYKASKEGVKIDLIIRGICCLRPGVEGISENIRVISIIGKYLEHPRIYWFKHSEPHIYISSADLMTRNLDKRVELMTPIYDNNISQYLYKLLELQLIDNVQAKELKNDGQYVPVKNRQKAYSSQLDCEEYFKKINQVNGESDTQTKMEKLASRLLKDS
jgi:polyphosphate kinase